MRIETSETFGGFQLFISPTILRAMEGHVVPVKGKAGKRLGEATIVKAELTGDCKGLIVTLDMPDELGASLGLTSPASGLFSL